MLSIPDRYTETVFVPQRRIRWNVIAQDIARTIDNQFLTPLQKQLQCECQELADWRDDITATTQRRWQQVARHGYALGMAAVVGFCAAATVYQKLTNG